MIEKIGVENLGLLPEQSANLARQLKAFEKMPLWVPAVAVLERVCSMAFHLGATLLVLVAVVRRRPLLLAAAIAWHAVGNAGMLYLVGRFGGLSGQLWLVSLLPLHFVIARWAFRTLPAHDAVFPPRVRPASSGAPIELQHVEKHFGKDVHALRGSSFTLKPGERACLLGPNGAGKTTTIRLLTGALAPSAGFAFLYGAAADEPEFLAAKASRRHRSAAARHVQGDELWPVSRIRSRDVRSGFGRRSRGASRARAHARSIHGDAIRRLATSSQSRGGPALQARAADPGRAVGGPRPDRVARVHRHPA